MAVISHRAQPATGAGSPDPLALTLQPEWGPPLPGQPFPIGSGNVAAPVVPPPVVPPVAKSWVLAPNDNAQHEWNGANFQGPLTFSVPPVKGCVVLSIDNVTMGAGQPDVDVAVYDGKSWQDITRSWSLTQSRTTPTFKWWCADRSYVDGDTFDPMADTDTAFAWAEADGIHLMWSPGSAGSPQETTYAYPAGVTLADMPASKTF